MASMTTEKKKESIAEVMEKSYGKSAAVRWIILRNTAIVLMLVFFGMMGAGAFNFIASESSEPTEGIVVHKYKKDKFFTGKVYLAERWVIVYENEEGERGDADVNQDLWNNLEEGDWYVS